MKTETVKLRGPNGTTKEISLDEWNSYTPLNRLADELIKATHRRKGRVAKATQGRR